jgi:lactoylglutathione lyase
MVSLLVGRGASASSGGSDRSAAQNSSVIMAPATGDVMRTLHFGLRVADLERSLRFYTGVGYEIIGSVPETGFGSLTMLKLPADDFVTLELAHDPARTDIDASGGLNHFVIHVESMDGAIAALAARGIAAETPTSPDGTDEFFTSWITDPDGRRIELVQWPAGHADGMTAADFAE